MTTKLSEAPGAPPLQARGRDSGKSKKSSFQSSEIPRHTNRAQRMHGMTQLTFDFAREVTMFPTKERLGITPSQEQLGLVYDCLRRGGEYSFDDMSEYLLSAGMKSRDTSISPYYS